MNAGVAGSTALEWLSALANGRASRIHIVCDFDADGLAAGALLVRSLRHEGYRDVSAECRRKGESAWGPEIGGRLRDRAASHGVDALIVADLGSRGGGILRNENGDPVPLLLIDHHRPTGQPQGSTLMSSYGDRSAGGDGKDIAPAGLMSWWAARAVAGESADAWLWLAAISILSDLGDTAPFAELAAAKAQFGVTTLRKAASLLNAPRRTSAGRADVALDLLIDASGPKEVTDGTRSESAELQRAKLEVDEALAIARKQPPRFSTPLRAELGADLVAIRMHSGCQVHPLIAQQWRGRFAKNVVFGVNTGYRPGWVHFSARAPAGINLIEFLARHRPPEADDAYGMGHDQASGGALPVPVWNRWIQEIGFGDEMRVSEE
jgi:single-stranded-DNA-specific exonuclease